MQAAKSKPKVNWEVLERLHHQRYYERDARIIHQKNQMFVVALAGLLLSIVSVSYGIYIGRQPATVIRINDQGEALTLTPVPSNPTDRIRLAVTPSDREPTDEERVYFVNLFLMNFENYHPENPADKIADAINLMTESLKKETLEQLTTKNLIGDIRLKRIESKLRLISTEAPSKEERYKYLALANKRVNYFDLEKAIDRALVMKYEFQLIPTPRTASNPYGLRIAAFKQDILQ